MPISNLCYKNLVYVTKEASLHEAVQLMKKHHVGSVVIVEAEGQRKPIGILTDRDIALGVVAENLPLNTIVNNVMSSNIVQVTQDSGITEVIELMEIKGVRRMIVVDESGDACGLVSFDDILQLVASEIKSLSRLVDREVENEKMQKLQQDQLMS